MKYAVDRFDLGTEIEVSADSISSEYIPRRKERFYCPECDEIVYFRSKGGSQPCQFYHKVKTQTSKECENRVDGKSGLCLYERVGLPIYLTGIESGMFFLNIGFPPLGENLSKKCQNQI